MTDRLDPLWRVLRAIIMGLALVAGLAIFAIIGITVSDVVLRIFKKGILGAYDLVRIAGSIAIACSLPYVTAVKGHIAIEFLHHRLSKRGRTLLDFSFRLIALALFSFLVWRFWLYGVMLLKSNQVMQTLPIPVFWMPWMTAFCFLFVIAAIAYHLIHPGKEFIKP